MPKHCNAFKDICQWSLSLAVLNTSQKTWVLGNTDVTEGFKRIVRRTTAKSKLMKVYGYIIKVKEKYYHSPSLKLPYYRKLLINQKINTQN